MFWAVSVSIASFMFCFCDRFRMRVVLRNSKEVLLIVRIRQCKNVEVHFTSAVLLAPRMTISVDAVKCFVIRRI